MLCQPISLAILQRDANGKGGDLFVNIHEECVGGPAAHFPNVGAADTVEVHGHGTACSE
jgi:hypothetical protein